MRIALLAFALALAAGPALALDCGKAKTAVEKTICAGKELRALDTKMSGLYRRALDEGQEPETLRNSQRNWLAERDQCANAECVELRYQERVARLDDYLAELNADQRRDVDVMPVADGPKRCLRYVPSTAPNAQVTCRVLDFRPLGEVGGMQRLYALYAISYRWNGQELALAAPVIFTHNPDDPTLLAFDFMITDAPGLMAGGAYELPVSVKLQGEDALLFTLPALDGRREVRAYRVRKGVWERVTR